MHIYLLPIIISACNRPNILLIVSDDVGWNDLDVHGSKEIPTPNINKICSDGVRLSRHYGQPACSPTRSTIMSGRSVTYTGMYVPLIMDNVHLDLDIKILPEYLNELGYESHMSGKWHLGFNTISALPTSRGFDPETYVGIWTASNNQYTHLTDFGSYNFVNGSRIDYSYSGEYAMYIYTERVINILKSKYDRKNGEDISPFFYYFAPQNNHVPWIAPEKYTSTETCSKFSNTNRANLCGMTIMLDEAVGNITRTLDEIGQLSNTIIIYTSDNGGISGAKPGVSSNYPLRGSKFTLWEGGVRLMSCIYGPMVPRGKVWDGLMHTSDWLPTIMDALGEDVPVFREEDGISVWNSLVTGGPSPRNTIVLEVHRLIDPQVNGIAIIHNDIKMIKVVKNNKILVNETWNFPVMDNTTDYEYTVDCGGDPPVGVNDCSNRFCLFNLTQDPCEYNDIRYERVDLFNLMYEKFDYYKTRASQLLTGSGCMPVSDSISGFRPCDQVD